MSIDDVFLVPDLVWAAILFPVAAWLWLRARDVRGGRKLAELVGPRTRRLVPHLDTRRRGLRRALFCVGLGFALTALAQPTWGVDQRKAEQRGVDLLICLDVSRSMLARDVAPSRLGRAQAEIRALAERTRGDRLGLVVFAGAARLSVPFTQDMVSFADLVDLSDPLSVRRGGTDLGAALEAALTAFGERTGEQAVVMLLTDGEDHEQLGLRAAGICRERDITVHCVGFGTEVGSKITVTDDAREAFLRDRSGDEVVSSMDRSGLRAIAAATGGVFVDARTSVRPLLELYEGQVLPMAGRVFGGAHGDARMNRFQWALGLALLCWVFELALADRRRR